MAIVLTTRGPIPHVYTADPSVLSDPPRNADGEVEHAWVPLDTVATDGQATVVLIRPLAFLAAQALEAEKDLGKRVQAVLEQAVVAVDDDEAKAKEFLAAPAPMMALGLMQAAMKASWGRLGN